MASLTAARTILVAGGAIKRQSFPLGIAATAYENGMACIDSANLGAVWPGSVSTTLKPIGKFTQSVNNSSGGTVVPVGVELTREHWLEWWDSVASGGTVSISNLFQSLYIASDHELTTTATGASVYGVMWGFSPQGYTSGVGVEPVY